MICSMFSCHILVVVGSYFVLSLLCFLHSGKHLCLEFSALRNEIHYFLRNRNENIDDGGAHES